MLGNSAFQVNKIDTYKVIFTKNDVSNPQYVPGINNENYYDHTGAVVTHNIDSVTVRYVNMTSSYDKPSKVTNDKLIETIKPSIRPTEDNTIRTLKQYSIIDTSGLSYAVNT